MRSVATVATTPGRAALVVSCYSLALGLAALGVAHIAPVPLILATLVLMLSFGLGQPAMTALLADSLPPRTRGGALGLLTLFFLLGGSLGAATVGGLGSEIGLPVALLTLTLLPLAGSTAFAGSSCSHALDHPRSET